MLGISVRDACIGAMLISLGAASALSQETPSFDPWQGVAPQVLTEQQFQDVLTVMTSMAEGNITIDVPDGATTEDQIAAIKSNETALKILSDAGYTPETFHPVIVNASIALSMAGSEAQRQEIQSAIESLKAQQDTLTPEQYDQSLAQMNAMLSVLGSVPAENLTLAVKHQSAFDALSGAAQ